MIGVASSLGVIGQLVAGLERRRMNRTVESQFNKDGFKVPQRKSE